MNLGRSQTNQQRNTDVQTPTPASLQCSRLTPPLTRKGEPTGRAAFVEPMLHVNEKDKLTLLFFLKKHPSPILSTMATLLCSALHHRRGGGLQGQRTAAGRAYVTRIAFQRLVLVGVNEGPDWSPARVCSRGRERESEMEMLQHLTLRSCRPRGGRQINETTAAVHAASWPQI